MSQRICVIYGSFYRQKRSQPVKVGERGVVWVRAVDFGDLPMGSGGAEALVQALTKAKPMEGEVVLNSIGYSANP